MPTPPTLRAQLRSLPDSPGVYQFFDQDQKILYIGKAINLKKRVRSYFQKNPTSHKILSLQEKTKTLKYITTANETEALILEANLISRHRPRYNILLRDDKSYIYIEITKEEFPLIRTTRRINKKSSSTFFGPKTSASSSRELLRLLRKSFPYRTCRMSLSTNTSGEIKVKNPDRNRPCLDYHLKLCPGCCLGKISPDHYQESIQIIKKYLSGKSSDLISHLQSEMKKLSANQAYEQAARLRDQINLIQNLSERQRVEGVDLTPRDIIGFVTEGRKHFFNLFRLREGRLIDQINHTLLGEDDPSVVLTAFLTQYYADSPEIPAEIILPNPLPQSNLYTTWLTHLRGQKVTLHHPQKGRLASLIRLSQNNAQAYANQQKASFEASRPLQELQEILDLPRPPARLECYDISHLSGTHTVGSMVVFSSSRPDPSAYRNFTLRDLAPGQIDDYLALTEVLRRRLTHLLPQTPDLLVRRLPAKKSQTKSKTSTYRATQSGKSIATITETKNGRISTLSPTWLTPLPTETKSDIILAILRRLTSSKVYIHSPEEIILYQNIGFEIIKKQKPSDPLTLLWLKQKNAPDPSFSSTPDLILLDGGKGQLTTIAKSVILPRKTTLLALAKKEETLYHLTSTTPPTFKEIKLPKTNPALRLLTLLRDESHRFANKHRRSRQNKTLFSSALEEIPGVGPALAKRLIRTFGSFANLRKQPLSSLTTVLGTKKAQSIYSYLHKKT